MNGTRTVLGILLLSVVGVAGACNGNAPVQTNVNQNLNANTAPANVGVVTNNNGNENTSGVRPVNSNNSNQTGNKNGGNGNH